MNVCVFSGRLTKDIEVKYTQGENSIAVARFSLAVDNPYTKGEEKTASFPNFVAFGKNAEILEKYVKKGNQLVVSSHVQTGSYEKDSKKVYTTDFIIDKFDFVGSKSASSAETNNTTPAPQANSDGFMNIPDAMSDELPFA